MDRGGYCRVMARDLNKFTFEEGLNALSPHAREWNVHDMYTWFDRDPSDAATTDHVDVSDVYTLTVECGDFMCISFDAPLANILDDPNLDTDTAASTTGTYWTTTADWTISGGLARFSGTTYEKIIQLVSLPANHNALLEYNTSFEEGGPLVAVLDGYVAGLIPHITETGVGSVFLQDLEDSSFGFRLYAGSLGMGGRWNGTVDYLRLLPVPQIAKSTAFAIPPGVWTLKVPKGLGDRIIFSFLPFYEPTDKAHLYMKVVTH